MKKLKNHETRTDKLNKKQSIKFVTKKKKEYDDFINECIKTF